MNERKFRCQVSNQRPLFENLYKTLSPSYWRRTAIWKSQYAPTKPNAAMSKTAACGACITKLPSRFGWTGGDTAQICGTSILNSSLSAATSGCCPMAKSKKSDYQQPS